MQFGGYWKLENGTSVYKISTQPIKLEQPVKCFSAHGCWGNGRHTAGQCFQTGGIFPGSFWSHFHNVPHDI